MPNSSKSNDKRDIVAARLGDAEEKPAETQAGLWITIIGAILTVSVLEQFTALPWFASYPLALVAGLLVTAGYLQLKKFVVRKSFK